MPAKNNEQLIEELMPKVYGYFFRRCNDRAMVDDLVMNTLTKLYEKLKYSVVESVYAYCWQIAKNELYGYFKSKHNRIECLDESQDYGVTEEFATWRSELLKDVKKRLSIEDYNLLYQYIVEEYTSQELALQYSTKPAALRQRISRIIKKLKINLS